MNRDKRWISVLGGLFFSVALSLAQTPVKLQLGADAGQVAIRPVYEPCH